MIEHLHEESVNLVNQKQKLTLWKQATGHWSPVI
jgi:hypothetical protein